MTEVIEKTENKKGYKKTKLGWIPEDWEVVKLGNIATEINDKVGTKQRTPMSLSAGKGFVAQAKKFGKDIAGKQYAQYTCLPPRTFAYNKGNSLKYPQGCIYQQPFNEEVAVPNVFICFALDKKRCNNNFYEQLFKNNAQGKELFKYINSGVRNDGLLNLNDNNFFKIKLVSPPLKEQEKIAEILSAWDDGIETLEKLIEQKEIFHKALMKNLLVGKKRIAEFNKNSEYKRTRLGQIPADWQIKPLKLLFDKRMQKYSGNTEHNIFTNSATKGVVLQNEYFDRSIVTEENTSNYYVVGENDFMYNPRISQSAPAGPINRNKLGITGIASPLYTIFKAKHDTIVDFYEQYFSSNLWNNSMFMVANQGARHDRLNITSNDFMNMPLPYPPREEKEKIANILIESYKEIQILNSKLEKLKEQKKGLMQKLLTGQIRVKV